MVHCVYPHFDCLLGSLTTLFCLCSMLMQSITPDRLTLGLWHMVRKTAGTAASDTRVERYKTATDKQSLTGTEGVLGYTRNRENRCQKCYENRLA